LFAANDARIKEGDRIMKPDERTLNEIPLQEIIEVPTVGRKNIVLDSQILSTLMGCPRLADFRFNHNFISIAGKTNSLECGSIVHIFNEYYYKAIINRAKKDEAYGYGIAAAEMYIKGCAGCATFVKSPDFPKPPCGHKPFEFPGVVNTPREPNMTDPKEKYKTGWQWVLDTCDQYYHSVLRNDHWIPLEAEVVKKELLYEDDEIRVLWKAKLDLVADTNQGIYPVDHKTMKQNRDTINLNNQFTGQAILMKTRGVYINKIGFQKTLKPEEKFIRSIVNYSAERLLEWQGEILPYYAKLLLMYAETGYWPPNYDHCEGKYGNCNFLKVCESNPDMREGEVKKAFIIGPEWNPTNDEENGGE
jgi:hypothetical protein